MKKYAYGLVELLLVLLIAIVLFLMFGNPSKSPNNPVEGINQVNKQKEIVNQKLKEIEAIKQKSDFLQKEEE